MRTGVTLGLGFLFDLMALPVTIPLWRGLIHNQVAEQLSDAGLADAMALLLLDGAGAVAIVGGLGMAAASACVGYASRYLEG